MIWHSRYAIWRSRFHDVPNAESFPFWHGQGRTELSRIGNSSAFGRATEAGVLLPQPRLGTRSFVGSLVKEKRVDCFAYSRHSNGSDVRGPALGLHVFSGDPQSRWRFWRALRSGSWFMGLEELGGS